MAESWISNSFEEQFPNPVLCSKASTKIKGLEVRFVFDKSVEGEDPIRPSGWIVTEKGDKFPLDGRGVREALKRIAFTPQSAEDAIEAAILPYYYDSYHYANHYKVVMDMPFEARGVPPDIAALVRPPSAVKTGQDYTVTFYVCQYTPAIYPSYKLDFDALRRHTLQVGKDLYEGNSKTLWGRPGLGEN